MYYAVTGSENVNGGWGNWNDWATCSVTCGGGTQSRIRECNNPSPQGSGDQCPNDEENGEEETQNCNEMTCSAFTLENYNRVRALIIEEIQKFTGPGGDIIQGTFLRLGICDRN